MISFEWPLALIGLSVVPVLIGLQVWLDRRRRAHAVRVPDIGLVRAAIPGRRAWRRHIPLAVFLTGLGCLAVATARPMTTTTVPLSQTTIMLAIDVSSSMCSTDVEPNRLTVAKDTARGFIKSQDGGTIGIVAFAGSARLVAAPTTDQDELHAAVDGITTSRGTAIGLAILAAIDALAEQNPNIAPTGADEPGADVDDTADREDGRALQPDIIVLLTDGSNSRGVDPVTSAEQAARRGVRVYAIGFGTTDPAASVCTADQIGAGSFDGGFGGGDFAGGPDGAAGAGLRSIDEDALQSVADLTGGQYFRAEDAESLRRVFQDLPSRVQLQEANREQTAWFVLIATVLVVTALWLSLRRTLFP